MNAQLALPLARATDPSTSHLAAVSVRPANQELVGEIRKAIDRLGPLTHQEIAEAVDLAQPGRWMTCTIVTACARAGLHEWDRDMNPRGRWVTVWSLIPAYAETIQVAGEIL